ncbi:hypothetical protein C6496_01505 [Candidatus Poribacteria bacterium]|nr:MAG: hypothetical protein C6496_01505 [Candidatus Poribacteria bacterium]
MKFQANLIEPQGTLKYWVPPVLYMVLIFAISSMEQPPLPMPEFEWLTIDKLYHFIEYAILGGLLTRAFVKAKPTVVPSHLVWFMAALLSILYGASDEWHQSFVPGRFATLADWVADVVGSIAGVFGVYLYYRSRQQSAVSNQQRKKRS